MIKRLPAPATPPAVLCAIGVVLSFCAAAAPATAPDAGQDGAVLSAVLHALCARTPTASGPMRTYRLLSDRTGRLDGDMAPDSVDAAATRSLRRRNTTSHRLPHVKVCAGYVWVNGAHIGPGMHGRAGDLRRVAKDHPGATGITRLTLPGYSTDGRRAVVMESYNCGVMCSRARFWVVRRAHGKWRVVRPIMAWVS